MITESAIPLLLEAHAYSDEGEKIGRVGQVFLDTITHQPAFVTVHTGLFGMSQNFVPLTGAHLAGDRLVVPYSKEEVKDAPKVDPEGPGGGLSVEQENDLYQYYDQERDDLLDHTDQHAPRGDGDTSRGITRSEEQLVAGTRSEVAGTARLRKYVVTEQETITVPVTHEEVRVVREPVTGDAARVEFSEDEQEVTLHRERPVVSKRAVPVERVRLETDEITEEQAVSGTVRKEKIETEGPVGETGPGTGGMPPR